jgi:hypothetical protein
MSKSPLVYVVFRSIELLKCELLKCELLKCELLKCELLELNGGDGSPE